MGYDEVCSMGAPLPRPTTEAASTLPADAYRALVEGLPVMLWRSNLHGKCDYVNPAWLAFRGRMLQDEIGDGWTDGVHPEDLLHCLATLVDCFYRRADFEMEYRLLRHDGVHRRILDRRAPYLDGSGTFAGFVGTCVEIDGHRAEDAIRHTEDGFRVLVESMTELVVVNQDGLVAYANPALVRAIGLERLEDLVGTPAHMLAPPDLRPIGHDRIQTILDSGSVPLKQMR